MHLKKKNLHKTLLNSTMNNDLCISQTYSNDNVKASRLPDTYVVMNKGELNTGKVTRTKTFINLMSQWFRKNAVLRLNLYLFERFVIIECGRTDKYTNLFTLKLFTHNSLNHTHIDRYCNRKKAFTFFREMLNNYLAIRQMLNRLC
jgi:hypothetical protein